MSNNKRGDDGGAFFPGVVDTFTVVRTDNQLRPHESFAPAGQILRQHRAVSDDGRGDRQLAKPPGWTSDDDLPCSIPRHDWLDMHDTARGRHWDTPDVDKAALLCNGCPVLDRCLTDAMAEEKGKGKFERYLVRGGMTPMGRWKLEQSLDGA
jgi:hypothetical protein